MGFLGNLFGKHEHKTPQPNAQPQSGQKTSEELSSMLPQNNAETRPSAPESAMASPDDIKKYEAKKAQEPYDNAQAQSEKLKVLNANSGEMKVVKPSDRYAERDAIASTPVVTVSEAPEVTPKPTDISDITASSSETSSAQPEVKGPENTPSSPNDTPPSSQEAA